MATRKSAPKQKMTKPVKSTLQQPGVTPPGKKPSPTPPIQAAPMRMNVKANKKGAC